MLQQATHLARILETDLGVDSSSRDEAAAQEWLGDPYAGPA